ncbi:DUF6113 family protein [Actinomadura madurae]|uniref:DUF6113 family protein n=1 Tax=Actinomadura madurae TaxID=1993 RepID=UPI0020266EBB|nr:DUF6113 family protein [Actinomadura madurae]MCP9950148.1 DUF6113 family protein [Actinomadura madurae]MCP9966911.1 DUF6113 family protein [Actinomadura madurae]MCQ0015597.1 DUF6113 family protein [Actinomadura madurae]URM95707.1 DUF6113 family protein [Actinomadura madurae]URN06407.1 DUF6113 family protein [Actinomadura madurae]
MDKDDDAHVSLAKEGDPAPVDAGPPGLERAGGEGPGDAFLSGAAYAALGILGGVFGVVGSFAQDWTAGPVPLAAIVLVGLVFAMARLSGRGMGGRLGGTVPAVVWGIVVFVLSMRRPEGDLVVPATLAGYVFIIGGMVAAVLGVMLTPPARPPGDWLLGKAGRTRG